MVPQVSGVVAARVLRSRAEGRPRVLLRLQKRARPAHAQPLHVGLPQGSVGVGQGEARPRGCFCGCRSARGRPTHNHCTSVCPRVASESGKEKPDRWWSRPSAPVGRDRSGGTGRPHPALRAGFGRPLRYGGIPRLGATGVGRSRSPGPRPISGKPGLVCPKLRQVSPLRPFPIRLRYEGHEAPAGTNDLPATVSPRRPFPIRPGYGGHGAPAGTNDLPATVNPPTVRAGTPPPLPPR